MVQGKWHSSTSAERHESLETQHGACPGNVQQCSTITVELQHQSMRARLWSHSLKLGISRRAATAVDEAVDSVQQ